MFRDYPFLRWLYKTITEEEIVTKNRLQLHLEWLLRGGEKVECYTLCPICRRDTVKYFFVRRSIGGDISIGPTYTSCANVKCIKAIEAMSVNVMPERYPLRFSSLSYFKKGDLRRVSELYKQLFLPPGKMTREKAFQLFLN